MNEFGVPALAGRSPGTARLKGYEQDISLDIAAGVIASGRFPPLRFLRRVREPDAARAVEGLVKCHIYSGGMSGAGFSACVGGLFSCSFAGWKATTV
jgi:hypothetical protein